MSYDLSYNEGRKIQVSSYKLFLLDYVFFTVWSSSMMAWRSQRFLAEQTFLVGEDGGIPSAEGVAGEERDGVDGADDLKR